MDTRSVRTFADIEILEGEAQGRKSNTYSSLHSRFIIDALIPLLSSTPVFSHGAFTTLCTIETNDELQKRALANGLAGVDLDALSSSPARAPAFSSPGPVPGLRRGFAPGAFGVPPAPCSSPRRPRTRLPGDAPIDLNVRSRSAPAWPAPPSSPPSSSGSPEKRWVPAPTPATTTTSTTTATFAAAPSFSLAPADLPGATSSSSSSSAAAEALKKQH